MAMLVKTYLTQKDYTKAVEEARKVMAPGRYSLSAFLPGCIPDR